MKTAMKKQNYGVKRRAKWGSKTRNGKPVEHLTYEITGFELKDAGQNISRWRHNDERRSDCKNNPSGTTFYRRSL